MALALYTFGMFAAPAEEPAFIKMMEICVSVVAEGSDRIMDD